MKSKPNIVIRVLSSLGLSCILLMLLGLLTWLGTLEQVDHGLYDVQKKYFESFFLIHDSGLVPIPLPGANLVMCVLGANLVIGGMIRIRKNWNTAGILITHVGIALLLLSGVVKMYFSQDGHATMFPGESMTYFQSYHRLELVVDEDIGDGQRRRIVIPQEDFQEAANSTVTLTSKELPFKIELSNMLRNSMPMPKGPMFDVDVPVVDGVFLSEREKDTVAERNLTGLYAAVVAGIERQEGILFAYPRILPWGFEVDGRRFSIDLRKERYEMPFEIRLDKFTKADHARSSMALSFSSDVTIFQEGETERPVHIKMNEPLRDEGLVVYQSGWGPENAGPEDELFSTLAIVRNPADQYPLYACIVISIGLVLHFGRRLFRYIKIESKS